MKKVRLKLRFHRPSIYNTGAARFVAEPRGEGQSTESAMKIRHLIRVFAALIISSLYGRDDERFAKPPAAIDAAFVAPAFMRSYFLDVQAIEPQWLYSKQIENWFPIESYASYVAVVFDVPTPIGKDLKASFAELATTSEQSKKNVKNGPMLGPQSAYIVFDSAKPPILIIYLHFGQIVTSHAHEVSGGDTFQAFEGWKSYNEIPALTGFLESLGPEKQAYDTPFLKWSGEGSGKKSKVK